jgi:hypothetical protein
VELRGGAAQLDAVSRRRALSLPQALAENTKGRGQTSLPMRGREATDG